MQGRVHRHIHVHMTLPFSSVLSASKVETLNIGHLCIRDTFSAPTYNIVAIHFASKREQPLYKMT